MDMLVLSLVVVPGTIALIFLVGILWMYAKDALGS